MKKIIIVAFMMSIAVVSAQAQVGGHDARFFGEGIRPLVHKSAEPKQQVDTLAVQKQIQIQKREAQRKASLLAQAKELAAYPTYVLSVLAQQYPSKKKELETVQQKHEALVVALATPTEDSSFYSTAETALINLADVVMQINDKKLSALVKALINHKYYYASSDSVNPVLTLKEIVVDVQGRCAVWSNGNDISNALKEQGFYDTL